MPPIERLTITLPADMAGVVRGAVEGGDYASASEVIREALRDWKMKRELQLHRLAELKSGAERSASPPMDKTIRKYPSFAAIKDAEYEEWQALPAHARLDAAAELSTTQYSWKRQARHVQPGLQRTLVRVQKASR